jgi:Skp family chaperone for outer membrane proteins
MSVGRFLPAAALACLLALPAAAQDMAPAGDIDPAMPGVEPVAPQRDLPSGTIAAPDDDTAQQPAPVLTLDQDVLYFSSAWGQRAQARLEAEGDVIAAENERLTRLLSTEEAQLTAQRATLPPDEFRRRAESFDLRATTVRRERAQAVQALSDWAEADRVAFFRAALPVMGEAMQNRGAVAVLDRRTVFVSLDAIDITDDLIAALDAAIGDGEGVVAVPAGEPGDDAASGQAGDPVAEEGE